MVWHPNGRTIAFVSDRDLERDPAPDLRPCPAIWAVNVTAKTGTGSRPRYPKPRLLMRTGGGVGAPAFSPDGRWLVGVGIMDADWYDDTSPGLLLGPADGSRPPWPLSPDLDRPIGSWVDTDLNGWMVPPRPGPMWADRATIVAVITDRGRSLPRRWRIDHTTGRPIEWPTPSKRIDPGPPLDLTTYALAAGSVDHSVVVLGTLDDRAMEVMTVELDSLDGPAPADHPDSPTGPAVAGPPPGPRTHTTFGSAWQRGFERPHRQRLDAPAPAASSGGPIETWVFSPPDAGGVALPTVVGIHGGPLGGWAPAPGVEAMLLTGAGFRVVLPNIRGSAGYGADWIRPQLGDWGGADADDVHAVVDHVLDLGLAEPGRLGIMGLSYGGFMVNWLVGTSDRFAAAVSENGVTNQVSAWANSDYGPEYCRAARLGDPLSVEGLDQLWRQSPLRNVAEVRTPLLMLQAESDLRCPAQDNEQFFIALRHLGRVVEYVLYPDEFHVYATSGRPDRRVDRMERVLDWFTRYLG